MAITYHLRASVARRLAVQAGCDPRTLTLVLAGAPVTTLARERAAAALREAGYKLRQDFEGARDGRS